MAVAPSDDEIARAILGALVHSLKVPAGQWAPLMAVRQHAQADGVDPQDFPRGLQYAEAQAWIQYDPQQPSVGLTDAGYAAAP